MPNQATSTSPRAKGWYFDQVNSRLAAVFNGTEVFDFDANDVNFTSAVTFTGGQTFSGAPTFCNDLIIANGFGLIVGNATQVTVSDGDGATNLIPEVQVLGTTKTDASLLLAAFSATDTRAVSPSLGFLKSGGATVASVTTVATNEVLGEIVFYGADGTDLESAAAIIRASAVGTVGTGIMPGQLSFLTTPACSETPTEALRLTQTQDALIPNGGGFIIGHTAQITMNALIPELQVLGSVVGVDGAAAIGLYSATAAEGPELVFARSKSATLGTNTIVAANDSLGGIFWMGADGSTGFDPAASIIAEVAGTPGASADMPGRILFQTSPDASQTPATRMTILSGAVTVAQAQLGTAGTSTGALILAGATSGTARITVAAAAGACLSYVLPAAYAACTGYQLTCNASGTLSWAAASLGALKNDLGLVCTDKMLAQVLASPVHRFTYNQDVIPAGHWAPNCEFTGIFGEEAMWAMQGERKAGISTINSVGALTASVQSLAKRLEALENKNAKKAKAN